MAAVAVAFLVVAAWAAVGGMPILAAIAAVVAVAQVVAFVTTAAGRSQVTIVFTDIARSTELLSEIGDRAWQRTFDQHATAARHELVGARAAFVKDLGDGFLAAIPIAAGSPGRAVNAVLRIIEEAAHTGLDVRAGIHTGECGLQRADVRGLAVHIAARVMSVAEPGQLVVTSAVRDHVDDAAASFRDLGERQLTGVRGTVHLYAVTAATA
jgi:class 3 adenylate cyclase